MSEAKNHSLRKWRDFASELRSNSYQLFGPCMGDVPCGGSISTSEHVYHGSDRRALTLTKDQNRVVADGYALMLMTWSDSISFPLNHNQLQNLVRILTTVPVTTVVACLKTADAFLLVQIQQENICSFRDFKHHVYGRFPAVKGLLAPMQGLWEELRRSEQRTLYARPLHTAFSFITRLTIPEREDLQEQAREKFLKQEREMCPTCSIQDGCEVVHCSSVYTTDERCIINEWFPNTINTYQRIYGNWVPSHGNGSVADVKGISLAQKYSALGTDDGLAHLDNFVGGLGYCRPRKRFRRISKVQFVPKSIDKLRTICMEPASLMFYQQGFMHSIVRYIHSHRYLKKRISLDKAYLNTDLACAGSIDGGLSTIDLSNASDSVSWALVRSWFSHSPLFDALALTRSDRYELDGVVRESAKYAPMGSALCFPVECLVFAAMCEATIRSSGKDPKTSSYRVYGDDIIIETCFAEDLIRRLEANGFKVNTDKSFYSITPHNYRESCGGEYLDGCVMTPFRISRKFSGFDVADSHSRWTALVDLANQSFLWLPTVRSFVINVLQQLPPSQQPFFTEMWQTSLDERGKAVYEVTKQGGLITFDASNFRLRKRQSSNLQRPYFEHGSNKTAIGDEDWVVEDIRLYEYLRSTHGRSADAPYQETKLSLSCTPATRSQSADKLGTTWSVSQDADKCPHLASELFTHLQGFDLFPEADLEPVWTQEEMLHDWLLTLDWD